MMDKNKLYFYRSSEQAILPSKKDEDAGYDFYMLPQEEAVVIKRGETKLINTGIRAAFSNDYVLLGRERGSTGTKGLRFGAGVVDSGYRGDIYIPINNTSNADIALYPDHDYDEEVAMKYFFAGTTLYPQSKAIGQFLLVPVPKVEVIEVSLDKYESFQSERGDGKLGSSGK